MKFFLIAMLLIAACSRDQAPLATKAINTPVLTQSVRFTREIFTVQELKFIEENRVVRVGVDFNYPPFIFFNSEGQVTGLSKDYMDAVASISGLNLSIQWVSQRAEVLEALADGNIDLVTSVRPSPDRHHMMFTQPYSVSSGVLLMGPDMSAAKMKTVGVGRGYAAGTYVRLTYPDATIVSLPSDQVSITQIVNGELDAALMSSEAAAYLQNKLGVELKAEEVGYTYPLGFGLAKENKNAKILSAILVKSIEAIPPTTRNAINQKWLIYPPAILQNSERKVVPVVKEKLRGLN